MIGRPCPSEPPSAAPSAPPLGAADFDVLICGASFAGLAVARELRASGARVLVLDRYEIGERQTSACAAPTEWLRNLGLADSIRQTFGSLLVHTPRAHRALAAAVDVLHLRLPAAVRAAVGAARAGDGVRDREGRRPHAATWSTPTAATVRAPLIVDALGWRRVLGAGAERAAAGRRAVARAGGASRRAAATDLELWIDRRYIRAGYGWSFPARDELRVGVGSFDPRDPRQGADGGAGGATCRRTPCATRATGSRTGCGPATEDGVFFVGDSAGHCLPLTAEGIRTALYFGVACGRELRAVLDGRAATRAQALRRYARVLGGATGCRSRACYAAQQSVPRLHAARDGRAGARVRARAPCRTGRSATTSTSRRPSAALPAPPASARRPRPPRCGL